LSVNIGCLFIDIFRGYSVWNGYIAWQRFLYCGNPRNAVAFIVLKFSKMIQLENALVNIVLRDCEYKLAGAGEVYYSNLVYKVEG